MTERIVDPTRQGAGNAAPKDIKEAPPPMSAAEALEYDRRFRWRGYPSSGDRARQALADEVERLAGALPAIIGCCVGKGIECDLDAHGWAPCCLALRRAREAGVVPQPVRHDEDDAA